MQPRTRFYIEILIVIGLSVGFFAMGVFGVTTYLKHRQDTRALAMGGSGILGGVVFLCQTIRWLKPPAPRVPAEPKFCPFCGALTEQTEVCIKCGRPITNQPASK
jgi:hypothetical protein